MIPLFKKYPALEKRLPYRSLGKWPTPVERLDHLGKELGVDQLYMKRDDLSGEIYGGNNVRRLEFLLGGVVEDMAKEVMTQGRAGSNHALATAIYAQKLGLHSILMLLPQPNASYVRQNLLMCYHSGAELHQYPNTIALKIGTMYQRYKHEREYGKTPFTLPAGGFLPLGMIGFVNAALELKNQIDEGIMPEPDIVYVPMVTMGTAIGLILGFELVNIRSSIIGVQVDGNRRISTGRFLRSFNKVNSFMRSLEPTIPQFELDSRELQIEHDFLGQEYGTFTLVGLEAMTKIAASEGIKLDGTYTGKTMAALISDVEKEKIKDQVVLFWNTHNSRDFSNTIEGINYRDLPQAFHRYFEEDVQKLDKKTRTLEL